MKRRDRIDGTFGVVLFDDIFRSESGWAYAYGSDEPVHRIHRMKDLPSETIWWSNIPTEFFHSSMKLRIPSRLRHYNYLFVNQDDLLHEWRVLQSMPELMESTDNRCIILGNVFSNIMTLAFDLIEQNTGISTIKKAFVGDTLVEDLRKILPRSYQPIRPEKKNKYTKRNTNKRFNDRLRPVAKLHYIPTRKNRFFHTKRMLQFQIPDLTARFDYLPDSLVREQQARLAGLEAYLGQLEYPPMSDIIIKDNEDRYISLYGMSANHRVEYRQNMHNWIDLLEHMRSSDDSPMKVKGICLFRKTTSFMEDLSDSLKSFFNDDFLGVSWSAGVVAESIWYAATYGLVQLESHMFDRHGKFPETSWESEWVLGANEAVMNDGRFQFSKAGFYAAIYGPGWVKVGVYEDYVKDLLNDSISFGFLPDMTNLDEKYHVFLDICKWGGGDLAFMLAHCQFTANSALMRQLDLLPFIPSNKRELYLEKLKAENGFHFG